MILMFSIQKMLAVTKEVKDLYVKKLQNTVKRNQTPK